MNTIEARLAKLDAKTERTRAKRLETKKKLEGKQRSIAPNEPNYLTAKQIKQARAKFGNGKHCMICGKRAPITKAHAVDHCHTTGKVRGILCHNCNTGLGYFKEDIELLKSAINYLTEHKLDFNYLTDEELARYKLIENR